MAYCNHDRAMPRNVLGEPIRDPHAEVDHAVCSACGVHLPAKWGCSDCEFIELPMFGEPAGLRFIEGQPCVKHTDWRPRPVHGDA